jgi:hypothetical protein
VANSTRRWKGVFYAKAGGVGQSLVFKPRIVNGFQEGEFSMFKTTKIFLAVFAMVLMTHAVYAQEPGKSTIRMVHGTFTSETGQTIDFRVPEGRAVIVKNKELGVSYRLVPQIIDEENVAFKVMTLAQGRKAAKEVERFDLAMGEQPQVGITVPFALAFTGISTRSIVDKPNRVTSQLVAGGSCCVQCGGWEVCCEPSKGWCCDISSSCGSSCSVCNAT